MQNGANTANPGHLRIVMAHERIMTNKFYLRILLSPCSAEPPIGVSEYQVDWLMQTRILSLQVT